jgi:hypothetical protein
MSDGAYNTNLAKAQGLVPETFELLDIWRPSMSAAQLREQVQADGVLGRASATRIRDIVQRGFAQRYLLQRDEPALWLKQLLSSGASRSFLRQLLLIFTARHNQVFHDFVTSTYWRKVAAGTEEITKSDTRDFLEQAAARGRIAPRWSDSQMERVTRYLLGTLEDFQMIEENRQKKRLLRPPTIFPETVRFVAYDLHFAGREGRQLVEHPDWQLFGLMPSDVVAQLEKEAARGHLQVQNAGQILRIEWRYEDMQEVVNAIAH